jgi:hypothetical protein
MFKKRILFLITILHAIAGPDLVMAQKKVDSLLLFREKLVNTHWFTSENPIWIRDVKTPVFTNGGLLFELNQGNFRRPQESEKEELTGFGAKGFSRYKDWRFYGEFNYSKINRDSIIYSNVARPYDGNPFITADSVGGNWKGDQLKGKLQIGLPEFGKWKSAINLDYETEQSARLNEPKPLFRFLNYFVQPAISYEFNSRNSLSITMAYSRRNETVETGFFSENNPALYSIRGYGTFSRGPVVTAERQTRGSGLKAGLDYKYTSKNAVFLIGGRIAQRTEDINDGVSRPVFIGGFDETRVEGFLSYELKSENRGWIVNANSWIRDGIGYDPIFRANNPAYYLSGINSRIGWWKQTNKKKWISLNARPGLSYSNYYESIAKTEWTSVMLHQNFSAAISYGVSDKLKLFAEPLFGFHLNLQKDIVINRPGILSEILVRPDFAVNSTNYWKSMIRTSAEYKSGEISYLLQISYQHLNANDQYENGVNIGFRNFFQTSMNIIF